MSFYTLNISDKYMKTVMKEVNMGMGRRGVKFQEKRREWGLPSLFYADDLVCVVIRKKT